MAYGDLAASGSTGPPQGCGQDRPSCSGSRSPEAERGHFRNQKAGNSPWRLYPLPHHWAGTRNPMLTIVPGSPSCLAGPSWSRGGGSLSPGSLSFPQAPVPERWLGAGPWRPQCTSSWAGPALGWRGGESRAPDVPPLCQLPGCESTCSVHLGGQGPGWGHRSGRGTPTNRSRVGQGTQEL